MVECCTKAHWVILGHFLSAQPTYTVIVRGEKNNSPIHMYNPGSLGEGRHNKWIRIVCIKIFKEGFMTANSFQHFIHGVYGLQKFDA